MSLIVIVIALNLRLIVINIWARTHFDWDSIVIEIMINFWLIAPNPPPPAQRFRESDFWGALPHPD